MEQQPTDVPPADVNVNQEHAPGDVYYDTTPATVSTTEEEQHEPEQHEQDHVSSAPAEGDEHQNAAEVPPATAESHADASVGVSSSTSSAPSDEMSSNSGSKKRRWVAADCWCTCIRSVNQRLPCAVLFHY